MEEEQEMPSFENGDARQKEKQRQEDEEELVIAEEENEEKQQEEAGGVEENVNVLQFMDSVDAYLTLIHSLSSTLRQGWLELAGARHSMGASRVNTVLLDHKFHPAATSLLVTQDEGKVDSMEPHFTLRKWASSDNEKLSSEEMQSSQDKLQSRLRRRGGTQFYEEKTSSENKASHEVDDQVQKERLKSLSVFGTLVSPKLRAAQLSFETALETLVEIVNMRSAMLYAFDKVHKKSGGSMG
ncbi:hypothetical protein DITRI_Ditri10aG0003000 [Diplodiscus trichospermus]